MLGRASKLRISSLWRGAWRDRPQGEAVATTAWFWNVKMDLVLGKETRRTRRGKEGKGWGGGEDFTREVAGIRTRESCWGQCGKGRPGVLLI